MSTEREPLLSNERANTNHPFSKRGKKQLTLNEKVLLAFIGIMLIPLCVLFAKHAYEKQPPNHTLPEGDGSAHLCTTPECVLASAQIIKDVDFTLNPCDDFDAYACGNWRKANGIPTGESEIGSDAILKDQAKQTLRNIFSVSFEEYYDRLNKTPLSDDDKLIDKHNFEKVKGLFDSCMDEQAINQKDAKPIYSILREIRNQFPASTQAINKNQLTEVLGFLAGRGIGSLFEITINPDFKDPAITSLYMYQSGLTLPDKQYYTQEDSVKALQNAIKDTLQIIRDKDESDDFSWINVDSMANTIVSFEKKLADISPSPEALHNAEIVYNPRTFSELSSMAFKIDWEKYISKLTPPNAPQPNQIIVTSPEFLSKLSEKLLEKQDSTAFQAYFLWRAIYAYANALSEEFRAPIQRLNSILSGIEPELDRPRWDVCMDEIDTSLGFMAGRYYVLEKFDIKTKESIKAIADDIKQVLLDSFHQLEWLDEKTRRNAERKLNKLTVKIGYSESSPDVMSPVSLSSYYGSFIIKPDDYFTNYVNGRISTVSNAWRQVGKPIDKGVWWMYPHEVDAYSRSAFNEIGIPAGILQGLYFEENRPEYLNYGAIGSVLGHEMTHGYDSRGRRYDADGRLFQWWTEHTAKEYEVKADCFVKQYNNFTVTDEKGQPVNVNGKFTLAENLADNGGVKKAVEAWKSRYLKDPSSKQHNNMRLPGLNALSPEQLFFISFARTYCKNITPAQAKKKVLTDNHAPYKWRINAPLQNSFEFAEAFRCPAGSPMNPVKKCSLW